MVMHHFLTLNPGLVSHLEDDFRRTLSDPDPGVMEASLILFHELVKVCMCACVCVCLCECVCIYVLGVPLYIRIHCNPLILHNTPLTISHTHTQNDPTRCKDLTESFTDILSQVIARKLPQAFDYHSVPPPWIQIRLLRILALLGADDLKTSEKMYHIVESTLASAECTSNIGQGTCVHNHTNFGWSSYRVYYPNPNLNSLSCSSPLLLPLPPKFSPSHSLPGSLPLPSPLPPFLICLPSVPPSFLPLHLLPPQSHLLRVYSYHYHNLPKQCTN